MDAEEGVASYWAVVGGVLTADCSDVWSVGSAHCNMGVGNQSLLLCVLKEGRS